MELLFTDQELEALGVSTRALSTQTTGSGPALSVDPCPRHHRQLLRGKPSLEGAGQGAFEAQGGQTEVTPTDPT